MIRQRLVASMPVFAAATLVLVIYGVLVLSGNSPTGDSAWIIMLLESFLVTCAVVYTWSARPYFRRLLWSLLFALPLAIGIPFWAAAISLQVAGLVGTVIGLTSRPEPFTMLHMCSTCALCGLAFCFVLHVAGGIRVVSSKTYLLSAALCFLSGIPLALDGNRDIVFHEFLFGIHKFLWISLFGLALVLGLDEQRDSGELPHEAAG